MPKLHVDLEPGQVVLIPAGAGASISYIEKSGRKARLVIESREPVSVTTQQPMSAPPPPRLARKPVPQPG